MRSVILDKEQTNMCGICGAQEPLIEYKELEGVHFIFCKKCNTISFFRKPMSDEKKQLIEKEMNCYHLEEKK